MRPSADSRPGSGMPVSPMRFAAKSGEPPCSWAALAATQSNVSQLEHLLQPSLSEDVPHRPLYSVRAGFFVSFFGGVHATLIFSFLNSRRLSRAREDLWLYLAVGLVWLIALGAFAGHAAGSELPGWLAIAGDSTRGLRYASRLVGLIVFGLFYLRLRPFYKAAELAGDAPPSPWLAALGAIGAGTGTAMIGATVGALLAS
jgi:hypothetical protein